MGVLASSHQPEAFGGPDSWQVALLVYNSDDIRTSNSTDEVLISLRGLASHPGTTALFWCSFEGTQYQVQVFCLISISSVSSPHLHPSPGLVYITYNLDNRVSNPYQLWRSLGCPDYPTVQQFRLLRSLQVIIHPSWTDLVSTFVYISDILEWFQLCSDVPGQMLLWLHIV